MTERTLIVQIPCFNEAETLPAVLAEIPRQLPGIERVEVLVVDDGSSDGTADVAAAHGADLVLQHPRRLGYMAAFSTALSASLARGADLILNTDGDHQYPARYMHNLVSPLITGQADLVIGDRDPGHSPHFSLLKRQLQTLGCWAVGRLAGFPTPDATSGFRAYTREAALRMQTYTSYTHTVESLVRFGKQGLKVLFLPIQANHTPRPSRLQRNMFDYILRQAGTLLRAYTFYEPLKTFFWLGAPFLLLGGLLELRFLALYLAGLGGVARYIHSVTIGGSLMLMGLLLWTLGLLGDALLCNRRLGEETLLQLRRTPEAQAAQWRELKRLQVHPPKSSSDTPDSEE